MKKIFTILLIFVFCSLATGAMTYDGDYYKKHLRSALSGSTNSDPLYLTINEMAGYFNGTGAVSSGQMIFTPKASSTSTTEGTIYADTDHKLYYYNGSSFVDLTAGASGVSDLDTAYDGGNAITVDSTAVTLTGSHASNDTFFINKTTGTGDCIQVTNAGTGKDINGTSGLWYVDKTGAATFASIDATTMNITGLTTIGDGTTTLAVNTSGWDITSAGAISGVSTIAMTDDLSLANGKAIKSSTTTAETILLKAYDVDNTTYRNVLTLTNGNTVAAAIGSGNETLAIDTTTWDVTTTGAFTGVADISGTTGAAMNIAIAADGDADDLQLVLTGPYNSSIILNSAGTGVDAIKLLASAGGFDIDGTNAASTITNTADGAADDLTISVAGNQDSSLILTSAGNGTDAITISTTANAGDIVISSNDKIDMDSTGTFALNAAGDTLLIQVDSDTAGDDLTIKVDGDDDSSIILDSDGTAADAVKIGATNAAGGIDIDAGTNGIDITATGGAVAVNSTKNAIAAISLTANGGAAETVFIGATQGTDTNSIDIKSTAGGIMLTPNASKAITLAGNTSATGSVTGDGGDALGGFLKTVTNDTDGKTLAVAESGTVQTNAGSGGAAAWTLPTAAAGLEYTFVVMAAQELRVTPAAGDKIVYGATVMDAAEYYYADAIGESLHIVAVDATNWIVISSTGTWAEQTP